MAFGELFGIESLWWEYFVFGKLFNMEMMVMIMIALPMIWDPMDAMGITDGCHEWMAVMDGWMNE